MEELKLKFTQASQIAGDETALYDVEPNRQCTLGDIVDYAVKNTREWGYIYALGFGRVEYRWGKLLDDNFADDLLIREVEKLTAHGGWSNMDYRVKLK